jgi:hypothetical protein
MRELEEPLPKRGSSIPRVASKRHPRTLAQASSATDTNSGKWMSTCRFALSQVNKKYPHGVGEVGAHDKTSGVPVTRFKRSTRLYRIAMSYNRGLDRDKDGIACEKL